MHNRQTGSPRRPEGLQQWPLGQFFRQGDRTPLLPVIQRHGLYPVHGLLLMGQGTGQEGGLHSILLRQLPTPGVFQLCIQRFGLLAGGEVHIIIPVSRPVDPQSFSREIGAGEIQVHQTAQLGNVSQAFQPISSGAVQGIRPVFLAVVQAEIEGRIAAHVLIPGDGPQPGGELLHGAGKELLLTRFVHPHHAGVKGAAFVHSAVHGNQLIPQEAEPVRASCIGEGAGDGVGHLSVSTVVGHAGQNRASRFVRMVAGVAVAEIEPPFPQDKSAVVGQVCLAVWPTMAAIRTTAYWGPLGQVCPICVVQNITCGVIKSGFCFRHQVGAGLGAEGGVYRYVRRVWSVLLTAGKGQDQQSRQGHSPYFFHENRLLIEL